MAYARLYFYLLMVSLVKKRGVLAQYIVSLSVALSNDPTCVGGGGGIICAAMTIPGWSFGGSG